MGMNRRSSSVSEKPLPDPKRARPAVSSRVSAAREMIDFALIWAPYGGPSEEQTFPLYGLSRTEFDSRVWVSVESAECSDDEIKTLSRTYKRHRLQT